MPARVKISHVRIQPGTRQTARHNRPGFQGRQAMTALVTGGTGFVGSAVVRRLLDAGEPVRALVRVGRDHTNLDGLDVERVTGDLTDSASLSRAAAGCDTLYHVAADYRLWVRDPAVMDKANIEGTRNVLWAAAEAGCRRMVYTSSVATLGLRNDATPADEFDPSGLDDMCGAYKRSKFLAEREVASLVERHELPVVIVNPSTPVGPRDLRPTPTGRMVLDAITGRMPAYVDTGLNIVHVDDVADGHLLAMQHGKIGQRYILGGENLYLHDILIRLAEMSGQPAPRVRLPHGLVLPMAWISECWARLTRNDDPRLTVTGIKLARKLMFFSSARARRELGYAPRPADEALHDAMVWFRKTVAEPAGTRQVA